MDLQAQHERMGVLSEQEAQFLLHGYVKEFESKVHSGSKNHCVSVAINKRRKYNSSSFIALSPKTGDFSVSIFTLLSDVPGTQQWPS
jgi:hypothetical protein